MNLAVWYKQSEGVILLGTLVIIATLVYNKWKERTMAYKKGKGKKGGTKK